MSCRSHKGHASSWSSSTRQYHGLASMVIPAMMMLMPTDQYLALGSYSIAVTHSTTAVAPHSGHVNKLKQPSQAHVHALTTMVHVVDLPASIYQKYMGTVPLQFKEKRAGTEAASQGPQAAGYLTGHGRPPNANFSVGCPFTPARVHPLSLVRQPSQGRAQSAAASRRRWGAYDATTEGA